MAGIVDGALYRAGRRIRDVDAAGVPEALAECHAPGDFVWPHSCLAG